MTAQEVPDFIFEIAKRAAEATGARAVYLFGSHARGEARVDSDVDLLLIVQDDANLRDTAIAALQANANTRVNTDFVPLHESRFTQRTSLMAIEASREGVLLVSAPTANAQFRTTESHFAQQFLACLGGTAHA